MIRLNQLMMCFSVVVGCLLIGMQNAPSWWHQFQLWRNAGISCERSIDDGNQTRYGEDCV